MAHSHHIIPIRILTVVFVVLLALTVITVITARIDLGVLNVPLALTIATSKAILVALIFMALKYDNKVNLLAVALGVIFVVVFLALTFADTEFRGSMGITEPAIVEPVPESSGYDSP
ncbi:MAG: cytochrome C oxidase subunit IV family protein [Bacteroidetes bacterium]|nr:cytochrome C oxidase subunit IV family protein [Bacteroidota bacterium]